MMYGTYVINSERKCQHFSLIIYHIFSRHGMIFLRLNTALKTLGTLLIRTLQLLL